MNVFYNLSYCNSNLKLLNLLSLFFSKTQYLYILHVSCEAQLHKDDCFWDVVLCTLLQTDQCFTGS